MYCEYVKHGIPPERMHRFVYYSPDQKLTLPASAAAPQRMPGGNVSLPLATESSPPRQPRREGEPWQLTFVGRLDALKGGKFFIDALPTVADTLRRPLHVTFAGEGPDRARCERAARDLRSTRDDIRIEFTGWLDRAGVQELLERTDVVVFPSVWPEPFGLVGPEAGRRGIPVAAFAVGGVRDWLIDGVNGFLAPGDPPTTAGLAQAIINCLRDPMVHERLRRGAIEMSERFSRQNHLSELLGVFESVRGKTPLARVGAS
jgi:glycosyltransferase involved in cell wall biosynthesis